MTRIAFRIHPEQGPQFGQPFLLQFSPSTSEGSHLHHPAHQQVAIPQRAAPLANRGRGRVALRLRIAAQAATNLVGVPAIDLLFRWGYGPQHQRVCHLQRSSASSEVIHRLHEGSLVGVSESASAEFSFCTPSAPPSTYPFKLTGVRAISARWPQ